MMRISGVEWRRAASGESRDLVTKNNRRERKERRESLNEMSFVSAISAFVAVKRNLLRHEFHQLARIRNSFFHS